MKQDQTRQQSFLFKNQPLISIPKKRGGSYGGWQKYLFYSSCFIILSFFSLKEVYFFESPTKEPVFQTSHTKEDHIVPLLLNLKSQQGPRLARVQVSISLSPSPKTFVFSQPEDLEKQLLFLLSGQPLQELTKKTFQNRIQNQLNTFLSGAFIQDLNINMEVLN